jgi:tetratricopeptide (TPR) repeat protein
MAGALMCRVGLRALAGVVLAGLLSACGTATYLVPAGGTPGARGYQQAAEVRWATVQENLDRAAYDEEQAIARDPRWPVPHARLAQIFLALGQPGAALTEAERAWRLDPGGAVYADNVGQLALQEGRRALAEAAFQSALTRHPGDWVAATGLATVDIAERRWTAAARLLRQALLWGGPQGLIYDAWGQYYWASGNAATAAAYYADAASANPAWWQPYYHLAQVELKLGQNQEALGNLQQALNLAPGEGQVWHLYRAVAQTVPPAPPSWTP